MKKINSIIAIFALAIVATAVAFVSCKKETEKALSQKDCTIQQAADVRQIEDINLYLKDFKKKMKESKGDEAYTLEDAAWHLACLANVDLCNANVEFNNVRFDTIEIQVKVNDGVVEMRELRLAYEQMLTEIQSVEETLGLDNQNLRFVDVFVSENGIARIVLMNTSNILSRNLYDNYWYFPDTFGYLDSICYVQFTNYQYQWNTTAKRELERVINVFEGRETPYATSYNPTRIISFDFPQWIDPYGSPFDLDSRLCAGTFYLSQEDMCYCLDSYLGLGIEYLANNYYVENEYPIYWTIKPIDTVLPNDNLHSYYHRLNVRFGTPANAGIISPPFQD